MTSKVRRELRSGETARVEGAKDWEDEVRGSTASHGARGRASSSREEYMGGGESSSWRWESGCGDTRGDAVVGEGDEDGNMGEVLEPDMSFGLVVRAAVADIKGGELPDMVMSPYR